MKIDVRPMTEVELPEADRIFRLAFGTFIGLPDPMSFMGDADLIQTRWRTDPPAALGAYSGDLLLGSNIATRWGSFGSFGPLTVRPDFWDQGVAKHLMDATMKIFERWGTSQVGLFTFTNSPKHLALYQKFGFWPQCLTPVMAKPVADVGTVPWSAFSSALAAGGQKLVLDQCRELTGALFPGLDLALQIGTVAEQKLGETVLLYEGKQLIAFAVCHLGSGSEAGTGAAYVKFGAARPGAGAAAHFDGLLSACEALAKTRGMSQLIAGVNTARRPACEAMMARGFRTLLTGVAMQSSNECGFNRPDCFVMDDWR